MTGWTTVFPLIVIKQPVKINKFVLWRQDEYNKGCS